eukprot:2551147-Prymnesium_polylepis.1
MWEDAASGLCANLQRVQNLNCDAFFDLNWRPLKMVRPCPATHSGNITWAQGDRIGRLACHDDTPHGRLSRHVITLHPARTPENYLEWWRSLSERDRAYAQRASE